MANSDSVSQFYLDSFGNGRIGVVQATTLNTAGNAVVTIPLLSGGLTNAGAAAGSGSVIVRRVTVNNPSGSVASANISITTSNDGNASNCIGNTCAERPKPSISCVPVFKLCSSKLGAPARLIFLASAPKTVASAFNSLP